VRARLLARLASQTHARPAHALAEFVGIASARKKPHSMRHSAPDHVTQSAFSAPIRLMYL
jgi:hypothetical protein